MNAQASIFPFLQTGFTTALLIGGTLWNADKVISDAAAKSLYDKIEQTVRDPSHSPINEAIDSFLNRYFSFETSIFRFYWNIFWLTVVSLAIFLSIYVYRMPGIISQLLTIGFLGQFILDGFVVTFLVNVCAFFFYNYFIKSFSSASLVANCLTLLLDLAIKVLLFVIFTALSFVYITEVSGAFGGDPLLALKQVPITILKGGRFQNLTGVYIYSLVMSSFPFFVAMLIKVIAVQPRASRIVQVLMFWLPFNRKPLRTIAAIFAFFCGVVALLASALLTPLQS